MDVSTISTRPVLAAYLDLEAAIIEATELGSDNRRQLRDQLVFIASRPNDNWHVTCGRKVAGLLRDESVPVEEVVRVTESSGYFRAALREVITTRFLPPTRDYYAEYVAARDKPTDHEGSEQDEKVSEFRNIRMPRRITGPKIEDVIDVSDWAWPV